MPMRVDEVRFITDWARLMLAEDSERTLFLEFSSLKLSQSRLSDELDKGV